jgi:hypothetical protein
MSQSILYYAVGWTVIVAFAVTLFITIGALIGRFKIQPRYLNALFVKLILEVVAAALFLFYRGPGEELPPYSGEWRGTVSWTDDWARKLMNPTNSIPDFTPINPRSEGELYIYRAPNRVYKGFSTWTVKNNETTMSVAAVLANNFIFTPKGNLVSFDVRAHSRRNMTEGSAYGPSPLYTWTFSDVSPTRLKGSMTTPILGKPTEIGTILLEHN